MSSYPPFSFDQVPQEIADELYEKMHKTIKDQFSKLSNEDLQESHANLMLEHGILLTQLNSKGYKLNYEQKSFVKWIRMIYIMRLLDLKNKE